MESEKDCPEQRERSGLGTVGGPSGQQESQTTFRAADPAPAESFRRRIPSVPITGAGDAMTMIGGGGSVGT